VGQCIFQLYFFWLVEGFHFAAVFFLVGGGVYFAVVFFEMSVGRMGGASFTGIFFLTSIGFCCISYKFLLDEDRAYSFYSCIIVGNWECEVV